eukprot:10016987-Lingulodinium_polyedra.AAC.1
MPRLIFRWRPCDGMLMAGVGPRFIDSGFSACAAPLPCQPCGPRGGGPSAGRAVVPPSASLRRGITATPPSMLLGAR